MSEPVSLNYSLKFSLLDSVTAPLFTPLAFPYQRPWLAVFDPGGNLLAVGATFAGKPVGLAAAIVTGARANFQTLMVLPDFRGQGIATRLVGYLETALTGQRVTDLNWVYSDRSPTSAAIERVLTKNGWLIPPPFLRVYRGQVPFPSDYPWMSAALVPPEGFEVFPWADLSSKELDAIKDRLAGDARYQGKYIGTIKENFEPRTSLGLRRENEVVGWCFTGLVPENRLLYYEGYFIRPDLRRFSRISLGQSLVSNVIHRHWQFRAEMPNFGFSVEPENRHMLRFAARYFEPFCRYVYHLKRAHKNITV